MKANFKVKSESFWKDNWSFKMWPQNASWFTRQLFIISSEFSCLAQPKRLLGLEGLQQALLSFLVTSKEEEGEGRQRLLSQKRKGSLTWPAARRRKHSIYTVVYVTQFWKAVLQQASSFQARLQEAAAFFLLLWSTENPMRKRRPMPIQLVPYYYSAMQ